MIARKFIFGLLFGIAVVIGCLPPEKPVSPSPVGGTLTINTDYKGQGNYTKQVFFDLETRNEASALKASWDLGFEASQEGFHVTLNSSKFMFVKNTHSENFDSVYTDRYDTFNSLWKFDVASGNLDSTAIGDWKLNGKQEVYIIFRGGDNKNTANYRKMIIQSVDAQKYVIRVAFRDGSSDTTLEITKSTTYNFVALSFENGGKVVNVEPAKTEWSLLFTQYTDSVNYSGFVIPYNVFGVLHNRNGVEVAIDSARVFNDITKDLIPSYSFAKRVDAIGWTKWKTVGGKLEDPDYTVHSKYKYIIKDQHGKYFKLHFLDFYNDEGVKGYVKLEYQKLD